MQHFDHLVSLAEQSGVKLIVALTNNWADYGGMDVYTINLGGKYHDEFYYNPKIISAYKNYVKSIVTRYKNSPTIFAWELANEPRCKGCSTDVIYNWAKDVSKYIKSLDSNHMVTLGDEGFGLPGGDSSTSYPYGTSEGGEYACWEGQPGLHWLTSNS